MRDLDPDLRPIGIYLIADYIWSQVRCNRRPRMLLIDEAWALFFARGNHIALRVEARPMEHVLATTDPAELVSRS